MATITLPKPPAAKVVIKLAPKGPVVQFEGDVLSDYAELIDDLGRHQKQFEDRKEQVRQLTEQMVDHKDKLVRLQQMVDEYDVEHGDDDSWYEDGAEYRAELGKKGTARSINSMAKLKRLLGADTFMKLVTVALKDVDAYLNPQEKAEVLDVTRGLRSVKITKR
jgi:hypothetical protein